MSEELIDALIIGRVEPYIYAFSTESVPNYLKVGDTYRPVLQRLDEWRRYFPNLRSRYSAVAKVDEETYFRDFAVHRYLEHQLQRSRLRPSDLSEELYYSREFFREATEEDLRQAMADIEQSYERGEGRYDFFKFEESRIPVKHTYKRTESFEPRPNQQETIERFKKAISQGRNNLLMYAVMRFGKSFTSLCCAVEMQAKLVLVVSAKADVREEWKRSVESHVKFAEYSFLDKDKLMESETVLEETLATGRAVVFLTLQDLMGSEIKQRHQALFDREIDLLLIDETHYGARAAEYGRVLKLNKGELKQETRELDSAEQYEDCTELKQLCSRVRIHLSGTPYRILMGSEFEAEDIIAFYQFSDIVEEQAEWDREHILSDEVKEWDNPYYGFPQMVRFAFLPNESSLRVMETLRADGYEMGLSELFRPRSILRDNKEGRHRLFVHEDEILEFLQAIDGVQEDAHLLSFLDLEQIKRGRMCRHLVFVLPYRASCDAMEQLLTEHKELFRNLSDYTIVNIAGVDDPKRYRSTEDVKAQIADCERKGEKSITLTVNRMLTGSTIPEWDTMLYLKDCASPQEYDQAIFRLQNQYIRTLTTEGGSEQVKYNMKPQTLLVDFDPQRMFRLQEQRAQIYNVNTDQAGNKKLQERIETELRHSPIVTIGAEGLQRVEASDIMDAVRSYSAERSVMDEATEIPIDYTLLADERMHSVISQLNPIDASKGIEIQAVTGEESELEIETHDTPKGGGATSTQTASSAETDEGRLLGKQLATYYAQILFYAFLTDTPVSSLEDLIASIGQCANNKRIARNVGLQASILQIIQTESNPFVLRALDYKIANINTLMSDTSLTPSERVAVAMKKFGRLSSSEIVTPQAVALEMIDALDEGVITRDTRILDIASKQGEFTRALVSRFGMAVGRNVYALPTSTVSYEFTLKVYRLLGLDTDHVISDFTTYDLIDPNKKDQLMEQLKEMNLNFTIGNPPYQAQTDNSRTKPIYDLFIDLSMDITHRVSLITPARYLFNAGFTSKKWNKKMLGSENLKVSIYKANSVTVFPNVDIKGGVAAIYYDKNRNFGGIGDFKAYEELDSISEKVNSASEPSLVDIIYAESSYRFDTNKEFVQQLVSERLGNDKKVISNVFEKLPDLFTEVQGKGRIGFYGRLGSDRCIRYIERKYIEDHPNLEKYKVFVPESNGSGAIGEVLSTPLIGEPLIGEPLIGGTQTFLSIGAFDSRSEAEACLKYIKTKFARTMLGILKATQHNPKDTWRLVPLQDFTAGSDIDWSQSVADIDRQLYKKYALTPDEIAFIEEKVSPMV
ncbi:Eco57I restriction-modification methylase domain-containing protein [uncultured Porphyromonas sp.]|uniref:DEAD/DEAH box helicase family protein n=1 Tax=uncultured Porphyromonas sp. TaxID=159274 RepID=UPI00262CAD7A|nr:Eco57I restriction-modification methylase domain-containing protein [uncultured Porphyromonas sp.]